MDAESGFLREALERGYVHQATDLAALDRALQAGPVAAYCGFDLTADSLHVGHLLPVMLLRLLRRHGHNAVALTGGGTTKVGDPSGRNQARPLLADDAIEVNAVGIRATLEALLPPGTGAVHVDNGEWLDTVGYIEFLRGTGRFFSVGRMLTMDSVRNRLENQDSLSFLEMGYMLLQAHDFLELRRRHGVSLQVGGGDQWGNIVMGVELCRRAEGAEVFGLTTPLLATASGQKMGKTADGAVWLHPTRLSPFGYWQFWRNAEDADVGRFLALFTDLSMDDVRRLAALEGSALNEAKIVLATEATAIVHGREAAEEARETARRAFGGGEAAEGLPEVEVSRNEVGSLSLAALVERAGMAGTRSEARRLIEQGGVRLNGEKAADAARFVQPDDFADGVVRLAVGKRKVALARLKPGA